MTIALAAPHAAAVAAGRSAIAAGGNALDAALAAAAMLTVVYPHQCAIGGDVIALVRRPDGSTTAVVAAGTAPAAVAEAAAAWTEVPRAGASSVTVPGMVAGWMAIAGLGAVLPVSRALAEAAEVAETGTPVSAGLARALVSRADAIHADAGLRAVFTRTGTLLAEGDVLVQPALADSLRRLAADPRDFYDGEIALSLVRTLREHGGTHTEEDFAGYGPEVVPALTRTIGDAEYSVAPPPSVGAILVGVAAAGAREPGAAELLEASVRGARARGAHLGDPAAGPVDLDALLTLDAPPLTGPGEPRPQGDTAAVVAIDDDGFAVTIVQSVYQTFGSGLLDPTTGILLHNRGGAFSIDPASPAVIRPGARPPHTLAPAIVDRGDVTVVAGCQGGRAQPWILAQLLPDATDPATDLDELLGRPRWVIGDRDLGHDRLTLVTEPGVGPEVIERAESLDLGVAAFPGPADEAGHVQLVRRVGAAGVRDAASDPRADGVAVLLPAS
ncbi:gamma-glutamyltransferase [Microbacterium sp. RURRCA19A]|uniref:gamma-glutamyltransferase n=1 Tax=Microbacterium sp. RURRCA19A TaxID=1907391 RepID=UPI0009546597|nr:gamma-glutamyltransferase [Microbacterium sp. RURRCA19A]SIR79912.1 gamma-glutamyltranspeptidase / glutathione hydrolase [Microbacterium sp. RURRCA19A]